MSGRLTKLASLVYIPAIRGVPAQPPVCVSKPVAGSVGSGGLKFGGMSSGGGSSGGGSSGGGGRGGASISTEVGNVQSYVSPPPGGYNTSVTWGPVASPYAPVPTSGTVCTPGVPGVPPVPARFDQNTAQAWDSGARSILPVPEAGYFECTLAPDPAAVQVGLGGSTFVAAYGQLSHSMVVRSNQLTVVEGGSVVFGPYVMTRGAKLRVTRDYGQVRYYVGGSLIYTSLAPRTGLTYAHAVLYLVSDYVDTPRIAALTEAPPIAARLSLPGVVVAVAEDEEPGAVVRAASARWVCEAVVEPSNTVYFRAELPAAICAVSATLDAEAKMALPRLGVDLMVTPQEALVTNMASVTPRITLTTVVLQGNALEVKHELRLVGIVSDTTTYAEVKAPLALAVASRIFEDYAPPGVTDASDGAVTYDAHTLEAAILLVAYDGVDLEGTATLTLILEMYGMDTMAVADNFSLGSVVEMLAMEGVSILSDTTVTRRQALQYAVNASSGALSEYTGFDFLGFAHLDRTGRGSGSTAETYGWRKDGLYRIGAADDDGSLISALVEFGASDLGTRSTKHVEYVYLGVRTDGECYLRVVADQGRERVYRTRGNDSMLRAKLAAGVRGQQWSVTLELVDASYATVDSLEIPVTATKRRGLKSRS